MRNHDEEAHQERQMLACATVVHDIPIEHLRILRLPVQVQDSELSDDSEEPQWVAVLVHTKGMRKILAETVPQMSESRSENALLLMLQQESKKKLFGDRIFTRNARARW
ncbi:hypothetical protein HBI56_049740 [Parastagonospora nodorum]|uniref:Uncharacterized protein n=2 Tax=Phaeosphaeria nodorum (strain SN15 / ATCC MYA-4574 / FGSC 10173) TaxID=321614 RepID=A0A7U2ES87_PHANO|nr:hypothetical protein SNOG_02245 [Parastagonospora nodorum SN15]KAH3916753.1 hypothetical protein HBH56_062670 [Parastagonospora nodorum]EAT90457.1 hypothetical protein SNOG_02245 [Parastagonospora nodorum SN15]KAH3930853.1 hypothetical protein HBH54_106610 [Parastagonospora nodorum]KAH3954229.1 hypothetical protein HBH53_021550 [Parastagonospora nodorum]KAH3968107.1 hypothetical protein HBH51_132120 [Parastagonospora nodorum]